MGCHWEVRCVECGWGGSWDETTIEMGDGTKRVAPPPGAGGIPLQLLRFCPECGGEVEPDEPEATI